MIMPSRQLMIGLMAAMAASPVAAFDLSSTLFFSERLEGRTGTGDSRDDEGFRSTTDLGLVVTGRTPTTVFSLAPGVSAFADTASDETFRAVPRLGASLAHTSGQRSFTASLSVVPEFVDDAQFEDTGRVESEALQLTIGASLGFSYAVDSRNSVSTGVTARTIEFIGDTETLDRSRSIGVNGGWQTALTSVTQASLSAGLNLFASDDDETSDGQTFTLRAGVSHDVNERLGVSASLGPAVTWRDGDSDLGLVGSLSASYDSGRTSYSIGVSQDVDQNSDGVIENRTRIFGRLGYRINSVSRLSLAAGAGLQTPLISSETDDRTSVSVSASYNRDLTKFWSIGVGYRFRASRRDDYSASNAAFIRISRNISLLP
jgi:hypothetical protein